MPFAPYDRLMLDAWTHTFAQCAGEGELPCSLCRVCRRTRVTVLAVSSVQAKESYCARCVECAGKGELPCSLCWHMLTVLSVQAKESYRARCVECAGERELPCLLYRVCRWRRVTVLAVLTHARCIECAGEGELPCSLCWVWENETWKCFVKRSRQSGGQVQESEWVVVKNCMCDAVGLCIATGLHWYKYMLPLCSFSKILSFSNRM